ncbi:hypothetical protein D3C80_440300 [compost metagenome]
MDFSWWVVLATIAVYLMIGAFISGLMADESVEDDGYVGFCVFCWPILIIFLFFLAINTAGSKLGKYLEKNLKEKEKSND